MLRSVRWTWKPLLITRRHLVHVLPEVERELDLWRERAGEIPDPELRRQALSSLTHKRFHCQGGSVFATRLIGPFSGSDEVASRARAAVVRFIVALQTISDYLDNLCDRTQSLSAADFRQLHQSMMDAISPDQSPIRDYYRFHPHREDGGYLETLVTVCRSVLSELPGFQGVQEPVRHFMGLYVDMQVAKHIRPEKRVEALEDWFAQHRAQYPDLRWWEFAAASGSTLAIFALVSQAAGHGPSPDPPQRLIGCYFPWICGLHILLDYLIDQEEDRREGDLNFVSFYAGQAEAEARMAWMLEQALESIAGLHDRHLHLTVVEGLLGLYLSDPKVVAQGLQPFAAALLRRAGWRARLVHRYCLSWRRNAQKARPFGGLPGVEPVQREKLSE